MQMEKNSLQRKKRSEEEKKNKTNSGAPNIRELYEGNGFKVHHMAARRSVSCKASTRVVANDIIAIMK